MANNDLEASKELQHQIRNIAEILMGIFKNKKLTIDEMVDLGIERLNEASIALIKLKRAKKLDEKA